MSSTPEPGRMQYTEALVVHGMEYRWNYSQNLLESRPMFAVSWHTSPFSSHLRDACATGKVTGQPSELSRVQALKEAFCHLINKAP